MNKTLSIFDVFDKYSDLSPQNLGEVEAFEQKIRKYGYEKLANELWEWRMSIEYHISREFDNDADKDTEYAL